MNTYLGWTKSFPKEIILVFIMAVTSLALVLCSPKSEPPSSSQRSELIQPTKWWEKLPRPVYAMLEKIDADDEWFEVYRIMEDTFSIYEPFQFEEALSYLVIGEERALVIDTGTGIGDLKQVVKELTDLPVSVVNTHTHWDHIGSNYQFTEVACFNNPECIEKMKTGKDNESLQGSITGESVWKPLPEDFDPKTWNIPSVEPTHLLEDGDLIDLGERTLEIIHTPGHSPGSICLLDKKQRILFTGDTFFPGPLYVHPKDVNIDDYMASIVKLKNRLNAYDYLCSGHNDPWVKSEVISRVDDAFREIMAGGGNYKEDKGIRRYFYDGFDILIRSDACTRGSEDPVKKEPDSR